MLGVCQISWFLGQWTLVDAVIVRQSLNSVGSGDRALLPSGV